MKYNIEDVIEPIKGTTILAEELQFANKISTRFAVQESFFQNLLNLERSAPLLSILNFQNEGIASRDFPTVGSDYTSFESWKNVENISARLIEFYDDVVILECLVDKELGTYEEREFQMSLFEDYELRIGAFFYLRTFKRKNEIKLQVHDDPQSALEPDFPKADLGTLFKNSKLFKK